MGGGAATRRRPQVTQEGHVERAEEAGTTWARGKGGGDGRTARQRVVGYLASRGPRAPPH